LDKANWLSFLGSFAAAWQSSIGLVVAGSPFAILQAIGMTWFIGIPVLGAVITSLTVAWWVWEDKLRDMWKICAGQLQNRFREWGGQLHSWWSWLSGQGGRPEENGHVRLD
jgi:hypothetical protein